MAMLILLLSFLLHTLGAVGLSVIPGTLRTESLENPNGISVTAPRFTWQLRSIARNDSQLAFQIRVASKADAMGNADLWDSGMVRSRIPAAIYSGATLQSRVVAWWQVRVWDEKWTVSSWSDAALFEMGLLDQADWKGFWIQNSNYALGNTSLPVFAKQFEVPCDVSKARLYLIGLGLHSATVNGHAVGSGVLAPGYSNLNKTKLYSTYDVGSLLSRGTNLLGIELGKGTYDAEAALGGRYMKFVTEPLPLMLLGQLEFTCWNGQSEIISSDFSWQSYMHGPLLESSWYGGEEFDARQQIPWWPASITNSSAWQPVSQAASPPGSFIAQPYADIKKVEDVPCASVIGVANQGWTFDFGVNFAGWFELQIDEPADTRVVMWPAEILDSNGWADQSTTGSPIYDAYTSNGTVGQYSPKFMYHGFRYLSVNLTTAPTASSIVGHAIRQSVKVVGQVSSSNALFNNIHKIIDRAIQSNLYSTLTDCPHREKLGWLEESHLVISPVMWTYDMEAAGRMIVREVVDSQQTASSMGDQPPRIGFIPEIAPEFTVFPYPFRDDPNWGGVIVLLPLQHYENYGDPRVLSDNYAAMKDYLSYLSSMTNNHTLNYGLGEWEALDDCTSTLITATYGYQQVVKGMIQVATYLSLWEDAALFGDLNRKIVSAFHHATYDASNSSYGCGSQGAQALALDMGAPPDSNIYSNVLATLIKSIYANGTHWTVGEIALPSLFRVLHQNAHDDLLYSLMAETSYPSYGYEILNGATSLWEAWAGHSVSGSSLNHFMFGYGDVWLRQLSGLEQAANSVGWNSIDFKPILVGNLTAASASYQTPRGLTSAKWTYESGSFQYEITVPVGATGNVSLPFQPVTEGGHTLVQGRNGILYLRNEESTTSIVVGSGIYKFKA